MDFAPNAEQITLNSALDKLVAPFVIVPADFREFNLPAAALTDALEQGGFFEAAHIPELGSTAAAMMIERIARLPCTAEVALSMLVHPHLPQGWQRPLAVVDNGKPGRFVAQARTLIIIDGDDIGLFSPSAKDVESVTSLFAYPMGRLKTKPTVTALEKNDADTIRTWLRIALACEAAGLMQAALDTVTEHLSVRKQFGRPLGSFQAVQHRMAECAMQARATRLLALRAASTEAPGDAAIAAFQAQDAAARIVYDLHQFVGAMGMTLEFPLHLWTYRLKALLSDLNGRSGQAQAVASHCF